MARTVSLRTALATAVLAVAVVGTAIAQTPLSGVGMVIMHGKGGSPARHVSNLASYLEERGCLVANLEMPWSGTREYDVSVAVAENEVNAALHTLRDKGARKVFVAGHSQGALFALYFGGKYPVDGIIAIAPGGNVAAAIYRQNVGASVELARKLVAEGRGDERTRFSDYEGSKGAYTVVAAPAAYLTWFDPDGAMNQMKAVRAVGPQVPVLYIVPKNDYPGLLKIKLLMFDALPKNPLSRLYEPHASHLDAPTASRDEIARWVAEVANRPASALGRPQTDAPERER
jgi:pimeloyl-ACP methyl ester carboxylesterase